MARMVIGSLFILLFVWTLSAAYALRGPDLGSYLLGCLVILIAPGTALMYFGYRAYKRKQTPSPPLPQPAAAPAPQEVPRQTQQAKRPAQPKAARAKPAVQRDQKLPRIEARHLHKGFVQLEKDLGPGGAKFSEAIQALNRKESDKAVELLAASLEEGLSPSYECYACCKLGVLSIERGNLERSVDWFLKCLGIERKTTDAAWEAAIYLYYIYNEAGLYHDANAVRGISDAANTKAITLSPEAEHQIRALTKQWLAEKKTGVPDVVPSSALRLQLLQCGEGILLLANRPDYVGVRPGHGSKGLIIIRESLEGITANLYAAAEALQSGIGMDGQPISRTEIASGLRRMAGDLWEDPRFRDYMKVNLSQRDYQSLCKSFANLRKCITAMAAGS